VTKKGGGFSWNIIIFKNQGEREGIGKENSVRAGGKIQRQQKRKAGKVWDEAGEILVRLKRGKNGKCNEQAQKSLHVLKLGAGGTG